MTIYDVTITEIPKASIFTKLKKSYLDRYGSVNGIRVGDKWDYTETKVCSGINCTNNTTINGYVTCTGFSYCDGKWCIHTKFNNLSPYYCSEECENTRY